MKEVIPFTCSECGGEFLPEQGGTCKDCGRVFCLLHLEVVKDGKSYVPICLDCRKKRDNDGRGGSQIKAGEI